MTATAKEPKQEQQLYGAAAALRAMTPEERRAFLAPARQATHYRRAIRYAKEIAGMPLSDEQRQNVVDIVLSGGDA